MRSRFRIRCKMACCVTSTFLLGSILYSKVPFDSTKKVPFLALFIHREDGDMIKNLSRFRFPSSSSALPPTRLCRLAVFLVKPTFSLSTQQNGKIICRHPVRSYHHQLMQLRGRIGWKLGRQWCIILLANCADRWNQFSRGASCSRRSSRATLSRSFTVLKRNSATILKRNYAMNPRVSLFWMGPALGDAVISSVRSVSP